MRLYTGCSGWSYPLWKKAAFYPQDLEQSRWLEYYSKAFDFVEVDSSFYHIPSISATTKWAKMTPPDFRFTLKIPQAITHEKVFVDCEKELEQLFSAIEPMRSKVLALLIQLPHYVHATPVILENLAKFCSALDRRYRYAIEARHPSWFTPEVIGFVKNKALRAETDRSSNRLCMVWNQLDKVHAPPVTTSDFLYVRLIGDRSISDDQLGKVRKDKNAEMAGIADRLKKSAGTTIDEPEFAVVAVNNHYAGFSPATINVFRKMVGLPENNWTGTNDNKKTKDFFSSTDRS